MRKTFAGIHLLLIMSLLLPVNAFAADAAAGGKARMDRIKAMEINCTQLLDNATLTGFEKNDPELAAIYDRLILGEIADRGSLEPKQRELVAMAALAAGQAPLATQTVAALNAGASPVEIREAMYQIAPYIGLPRVEAALKYVNDVFEKRGIKLPLEKQGTVTEANRFQEGLSVQKKIFGSEAIENMQAKAPDGQKDIVTNYLSAFCFGDFYTRMGLDLKMRELMTFSAIVALGGCDSQAKAHAAGNISVGNSKQNLVDALAAMLPYIGFPRTLNGLAAVNAAVPEK